MSSIRIRFIRGDEVKFISHLDLMKTFESAIRRSGLPIAYSQGFNPHPQMVFGLPLPVGVTSEAEYADFELAEEICPDEFLERLNKQMPSGLKIDDAGIKTSRENIMATIAYASYDVLAESKMGITLIIEKTDALMSKPEILVKKQGKKDVRTIDIKQMIISLNIKDRGHESFCISMLLRAGSVANLRPELLISGINELTGSDIKVLKVNRKGLFVNKGQGTHPEKTGMSLFDEVATNPLDNDVLM